MAKKSRINLKNKFLNGDIPTENDFGDVFDSFVHLDDSADVINGLSTMVAGKLDKNNPVTPGTATKVTYDANGLVTGGTTLSASDVPNLDWDTKILNKPTSMDGYGIADGVTVTEMNNAIAMIVNSAPDTLKTLNDLAAAIGEDANFASTMTDLIGTKVPKNAAIAPGTATKVTYDANGLVTGGTTLSSTDIPDLDWSKITTGKPSTLSDYGVTMGDISENNSNVLTVTGATGAVIGSGVKVEVKKASSAQDGYLGKDDYSTFSGKQNALGFTPENNTNRDTDAALSSNSDSKYPSQKAVKTYVDGNVATLNSRISGSTAYNLKDYGAKSIATTGSITTGTKQLTVPDASLFSVGDPIWIDNAGKKETTFTTTPGDSSGNILLTVASVQDFTTNLVSSNYCYIKIPNGVAAQRQIHTIYPSLVVSGDTFYAQVNGIQYAFTTTSNDVTACCNGLIAAINGSVDAFGNNISGDNGVTASLISRGFNIGVQIAADVPGVPFTYEIVHPSGDSEIRYFINSANYPQQDFYSYITAINGNVLTVLNQDGYEDIFDVDALGNSTYATSTSAWSQVGSTNVWTFYCEKNPKSIKLNGVLYYSAPNAASVDSTYRWYWDYTTNLLYVYATANPATFYSTRKRSNNSGGYSQFACPNNPAATILRHDNAGLSTVVDAIDIPNHIVTVHDNAVNAATNAAVYFDCTNAINAAKAAVQTAGCGYIYIPAGNWYLPTKTDIYLENVSVRGAGKYQSIINTFPWRHNGLTWGYNSSMTPVAVNGLEISDFCIDGHAVTPRNGAGGASAIQMGYYYDTFGGITYRNVQVHDLYIKNIAVGGLTLDNVSDCKIFNNTLENCKDGIATTCYDQTAKVHQDNWFNNIVIENNTIKNIAWIGINTQYMATGQSGSPWAYLSDRRTGEAKNVTVRNNYIEQCWLAGFEGYGNNTNLNVLGNTIRYVEYGGIFGYNGGGHGGIQIKHCSRGNVLGNIVEFCNYGISLTGHIDDADGKGITGVEPMYSFNVADNAVSFCGYTGVLIQDKIRYLSVNNNNIVGCPRGIYVIGSYTGGIPCGVEKSSISYNTLAKNEIGLFIGEYSKTLDVSNNIFINNGLGQANYQSGDPNFKSYTGLKYFGAIHLGAFYQYTSGSNPTIPVIPNTPPDDIDIIGNKFTETRSITNVQNIASINNATNIRFIRNTTLGSVTQPSPIQLGTVVWTSAQNDWDTAALTSVSQSDVTGLTTSDSPTFANLTTSGTSSSFSKYFKLNDSNTVSPSTTSLTQFTHQNSSGSGTMYIDVTPYPNNGSGGLGSNIILNRNVNAYATALNFAKGDGTNTPIFFVQNRNTTSYVSNMFVNGGMRVGDCKPATSMASGKTGVITAVTKGTTTTITCANHGMSTGNMANLFIYGFGGIPNSNWGSFVVTKVDNNTFTISLDSSAYTGAFASGYFQPVGNLEAAGCLITNASQTVKTNMVSVNTTLDDTFFVVLVSGTTTITLPSASTCPGRIYKIKKTDPNTILTVAPSGSNLIDGKLTFPMYAQNDSIEVVSDGTSNWYII